MADPLRRLTPARQFPSDIEDSVLRIAEIRRAFLMNNLQVLQQPIRTIIRESWQRCVPMIEPGLYQAPVTVVSDAELRDFELQNAPFLKAARPVVRHLTELISGSSYTIGLADGQGHLLQVSGDRPVVRRLERIGLTPGGNWSEATVGTNGIGTAIAVGHAVVVIGPEHFCDGWQDFTCITVPIHMPWGNEIAGVLDLSGDYHLMRPFITGILSVAALEIKENLKHLLTLPAEEQGAPFKIAFPVLPGGAAKTRHEAQTAAHQRKVWYHPSRIKSKPSTVPNRQTFAAQRLAIATGTVSSSLDIENTLSQVAKQAAYLLEMDDAAVCILDELGKPAMISAWSRFSAHANVLIGAIKTFATKTDTINLLRENGEPIVIEDIDATLPLFSNAVEQPNIRALALLPLLNANSVMGFIAIVHASPYHWQSDDLQLGLSFALHAATAIENARLFQTLQQHHRHGEALNAINQMLHTLFDPTQQLDLIINRIVEIMSLDAGIILMDRGVDNKLTVAAQTGLPITSLTDLLEIGDDHAFNGNSALFCQQRVDRNPIAERLGSLGMCDLMIAPLVAGGDLFGILMVGGYHHHELNHESLTLFTNIGQQLGMALKNAQLLRAAGETQALREADRIKSQFLAMVSHDLRSPLTAIRTSVESLLDQSSLPSAQSQEHLLLNIASQSKRLGKMVDQLLDLTKIEAKVLVLDRDWTELGALIVDTLAKFARLNSPYLIKQHLAKDLPLVYIDPERIVQVLWNLLENAHKYASSDGEIQVDAFSAERAIYISVADRGPGIPIEDREKIFQYFYRLPREQEMHTPGSGLGLAICRGIIDAHGGRIWVEDRLGGGSIFSIALPYSFIDPADLPGLEPRGSIGVLRDPFLPALTNRLTK